MPKRLALTRPVILLAALLLVSACGFHLRGNINLPPGMHSVLINSLGKNATQDLAQILRQQLVTAGVQASISDKSADSWQIDILQETLLKRQVSFSREMNSAEIGMTLSAEWQLRNPAGDIVIEPNTVMSQNVFRQDSGNVAGQNREEHQLLDDMRHYLARQILMRVERAQRTPAAPAAAPAP